MEWWYTTGHATTAGGRRSFWFATIWASPLGAVGRVNVVDLARDKVVLAGQWTQPARPANGARDLAAGGLHIRWRPAGRFGRLSVERARPAPPTACGSSSSHSGRTRCTAITASCGRARPPLRTYYSSTRVAAAAG